MLNPSRILTLTVFFLSFFWGNTAAFAQNEYPTDYFQSPLNIPLYLAGNFGELRANHFHSGLDLKTQHRSGLDVLAAADGHVSRVKIGTYGYGKVVYVEHPNGLTTVYGHLQEFSPKIREYVRERMYVTEKNEIELYPRKGELPVKQGEVIAKSGATGGVAGPHLHYEIRDGQQRPLNPLLFGLKIKDNRPPSVRGLYVYPSGPNAHVEKKGEQQEIFLTKQPDGTLKADPVTAYGKIGFGISALDYMDDVPNTNGMYTLETKLNGQELLHIQFDRFSFGNSRYINRYLDYAYLEKHKKRIQKLFMEPNNQVDMQISQTNNGFLDIADGLDYLYEIRLTDFAGNETKVIVPLKGMAVEEEEVKRPEITTSAFYAYWNKPNVFNLEYHDIYIPKEALYEDVNLNLEDHPGKVIVHDPSIPLHKEITIGFDAGNYTEEDREKLYVAREYPNGKTSYSKTYKEGSRITTKTRSFGTYILATDRTPPSITPVNFKNEQWVSNLAKLRLRIKDHDSGVSTFRATLNEKFIVMEYDYKTGILFYDFRDGISDETENRLKIIVVDNVGNSSTYEATFYRKQRS